MPTLDASPQDDDASPQDDKDYTLDAPAQRLETQIYEKWKMESN